MGREKRKGRLDKAGGTSARGNEFIGFGAFDSSSSSGASGLTRGGDLEWSPVYGGADSQMRLVFKKMAQKRDPKTKTRSIEDITRHIQDDAVPRKDRVASLCHFVFLFHSKFAHDDASVVRTVSLWLLRVALEKLPRAWENLVLKKHPELWGMVWCAQEDSQTEVQSAAKVLCDKVAVVARRNANEKTTTTNSNDHQLIDDGVWLYVKRILSYGRASKMHQELFASKTQPVEINAMSETERDELNQRFQRITGNTISGLDRWIQQHPETDAKLYNPVLQDPIIWKHLSSADARLRRKTYGLLATMTMFAKSAVFGEVGSGLPKMIPTLVSREKEGANIPALFDVVLLYLKEAGDRKEEVLLDVGLLTKHLGSLLKKSCLGAQANGWAPSMLPLIALLMETQQHALTLLTSLWKGREAALGSTDQIGIVTAVTECAAFLLLRRSQENQEDSFVQEVGDLWCRALEYFLASSSSSTNRGNDENLCRVVGTSLDRIDRACQEREDSSVYQVKAWFWNERMPSALELPGENLRRLLAVLMEKPEKHADSQLQKLIKTRVLETLSSVKAPPEQGVHKVLVAGFEYVGASRLFDENVSGALEQFLLNQLLGWAVIHTSQRTRGHGLAVKRDFALLRLCYGAIRPPAKQTSLLQTFVHEIVKAGCKLSALVAGLEELCRKHDPSVETIRSEELDNLCIRSVQEAMNQTESRVDATDVNCYLRACIGLNPALAGGLVERTTVSSIVGVVLERCSFTQTSSEASALLLGTLLEAAAKELLGDDEHNVHHALLSAWRFGEAAWDTHAMSLLKAKPEHFPKLCREARNELSQLYSALSAQHSMNGTSAPDIQSWSAGASRLFLAARDKDVVGDGNRISISQLGLEGLDYWASDEQTNSDVLLCVLHYLLEGLASASNTIALDELTGDGDSFLHLLLGISSGPTPFAGSRHHDTRISHILNLLKQRSTLANGTIESWCGALTKMLPGEMRSGSQLHKLKACVSLLSELVGERMTPLVLSGVNDTRTKLDQSEVREGVTYWYARQPQDPLVRVQVVKIHTDDYPHLYFTVKPLEGASSEERQTEATRLRTWGDMSLDDAVTALPSDEREYRDTFGSSVLETLVKPWLVAPAQDAPAAVQLVASECLNLIIFQCGLVGRSGIGSMKYDVLQILQKLQQDVVSNLDVDTAASEVSLRNLTSALGIGWSTPPSQHTLLATKFEPSITDALVQLDYEPRDSSLDIALLEWFVVCPLHCVGDANREKAFSLFHRVALSALLRVKGRPADSTKIALLVMKICCQVVGWDSLPESANERDVYSEVLSILASSFPAATATLPLQTASPKPVFWHETTVAFLTTMQRARKSLLAHAAKRNADPLVEAFFVKTKRWFAFRLLLSASQEWNDVEIELEDFGDDDNDDDDKVSELLHPETQQRLKVWQEGLIEEEASELRDDVCIVGQCLPEKLMTETESWIEDTEFVERVKDETILTGRMLTWMCLLEIMDSASSSDSGRIRGGFSAYLRNSGAANLILNLVLLHLPLDEKTTTGSSLSKKKGSLLSWKDLVVAADETCLVPSELAPVVLQRTAQVLPTLTKLWWEETCPKSLTGAVSRFVEDRVAPESLRLELARLQQQEGADHLGELLVTGSVLTREVSATYEQDDCQLSVVIQVPANFPLRNVRVDGRKTLGIPEKRWKRWALLIRRMLNNQDGTLLDALKLWKENVDKEFEGVEPCPVCYSVLSVKTHELPTLQCRTCKNRFHASCLYKWFNTSGKSQCVLCQQPWSGTHVC